MEDVLEDVPEVEVEVPANNVAVVEEYVFIAPERELGAACYHRMPEIGNRMVLD